MIRLPITPTLTKLYVTFDVTWPVFLQAAHIAAAHMADASGRLWRVDGFKSDCLYLCLPCDPLVYGMAHIDAELDLDVTPDGVSIGVLTRSPGLLRTFRAFVEALTQSIPRREE